MKLLICSCLASSGLAFVPVHSSNRPRTSSDRLPLQPTALMVSLVNREAALADPEDDERPSPKSIGASASTAAAKAKSSSLNPGPSAAASAWIKSPVALWDTTLRDGAQSEGVSLSVQDKLLIVDKLLEWGVSTIEVKSMTPTQLLRETGAMIP